MPHVINQGRHLIILDDGPGTVLIRFKSNVATANTTCRIFQLLNRMRVPTHYIEQVDEITFRARMLRMYTLELSARRVAGGSFLKRHTDAAEGQRFDPPDVEFFEKPKRHIEPEGDDSPNGPLLVFQFPGERLWRYDPNLPINAGPVNAEPIDKSPYPYMNCEFHLEMVQLARDAFGTLEEAFLGVGAALVGLKVELGLSDQGLMLIGSVINKDHLCLRVPGEEHNTFQQIKPSDNDVAKLTERFVTLGQ